MPTGYTAMIEKGATFEQFVWGCARAFGANIMMRDDPQNSPVVDYVADTKYHDDGLVKARADLKRVQAMTIEQADGEAEDDYQKAMQEYRASETSRNAAKAKYEAMLAKVKVWVPPSLEHNGLRDFMVKQIEETIAFDCKGYDQFMPKLSTGRDWLNEKLTRIARDIRYHAEEREKEISRTNERNDWNRKLRDSVPQPEVLM